MYGKNRGRLSVASAFMVGAVVLPWSISGCGSTGTVPDGSGGPVVCTPFSGYIATDTTLAAGCYVVESDLSVTEDAVLTISPGVTLKFASGVDMTIAATGRIVAIGTVDDPIVLTGKEATPGYWGGLRIYNSNSANNRLEYVTIEYGGGYWDANLYVTGTSSQPARLAIANCTLQNSETWGLLANENAILEGFTTNTLTGNANGAASMPADIVGYLDSAGTYVGNTVDIVQINGGTVESDQTWAGIDAQYSPRQDVGVSASLTMEPGVRLAFESGVEMTVNPAGEILAEGTAEDPIVFTGREATPGYWGGLRIYNSNSGDNRLDHVTIEYGGGYWDANLYVTGTSSQPARLAIANCTLQNSETWGLLANENAILEGFTTNTLTGNANGAASMPADIVGYLDGASTYVGNTVDIVRINGGTVESDQTWAGIDAEYSPHQDVGVSASLTMEPGARLAFESGVEMTVNPAGEILAEGTAEDPIVFTGWEATPGYWGGLRIYNSSSENNRLDHVTIEYGGGYWDANLYVAGTSSQPSRVVASNCTFLGSETWGAYFNAYGLPNADFETVNIFSDNAEGDVYYQP